MKNLFIILFLISTSLFASQGNMVEQAGYNNLSTAQQALIAKQVADMQEQTTVPTKTNVETAKEWVSIGSEIGKGLAGAAKELGIAVNQFAKTDVGILVTWLVIWNYIGEDLLPIALHITMGFSIWIVGFIASTIHYYRIRTFEIKSLNGKEVKIKNKLTSDELGTQFALWAAPFILGLITILTW